MNTETEAKISRTSDTPEVAAWCMNNGFTQADILGRWVWIRFESKPSDSDRAKLKEAGFRWVKSRGEWAHCCGHFSRKGSTPPRFKYSSLNVQELLAA